MCNKPLRISFFVIFFTAFLTSFSQKTAYYSQPNIIFKEGFELYQKEKYSAAQNKFEKIIKSKVPQNSSMYVQSKYYNAVCAFHLHNKNTESLLLDFIERYPEENITFHVHFYLARWYFMNRSYKKSLKELNNVEPYLLTNVEQLEYKYRKAYCLLQDGNAKDARVLFNEVKSQEGDFQSHATYYFAHTSYEEEMYETALTDFMSLKDDKYYGAIVPYYIIQIYYLQEKYDDIFSLAPELLQKTSEKRKPEIKRILGEAQYRNNNYEEAIENLNYYMSAKGVNTTRSDYYVLGYSAYQLGDYVKALNNLKNVTTENDILSQNAYFVIGDCFLKTQQKQYASNAFYEAYKLDIDPEITEESLYNYAKLQYELSSNPFQNAISSFEDYVNKYPSSPRIDEVNEYLLTIYQTTKNYKAAIASLEKINNKNHSLLKAYQQTCYYRAIELFNNGSFRDAVVHFDKSLKHNLDAKTTSYSHYWKAEALYNMNNFKSAIATYNSFLTSTGSFGLPEFARAYYNIGYAHFKQKEFNQALMNYRKFINDSNSSTDRKILNDAYNRAGDCYYISKEFAQSVSMYTQAANIGLVDGDYSLMQRALANGAQGKMAQKRDDLLSLKSKYSKSAKYPEAMYELANTYIAMVDLDNAIKEYTALIETYPENKNIRSAKLKLGLAYYNKSDDNKALGIWKNVVENYPGSQESKDALVNIRNIYVENDNVDEFFTYVKNIPSASISTSEQDSLSFKVVENRYLENDCEKTILGSTDYLNKFPKGYFTLKANYYKAECELKKNNIDDALATYEHILFQYPKSNYEERALAVCADIYYQKRDYNKSANYYQQLQAITDNQATSSGATTGKMRSYFNMNMYEEAILAAQEVLEKDKLSEQLIEESRLTIIRSAMKTQKYELAKTECEKLQKNNNEASAEAYYTLSEILFFKGDFDGSEKMVFELLSSGSPYEFWLAKSYILLGDIYVERGNLFQAKHTYKSIMDNYEGEDLVILATDKYQHVLNIEEQQNQAAEDFDNQDEDVEDEENDNN